MRESSTPQPDGCWVWKTIQRNGYGSAHYRGISTTAHRFSYLAFIGPIMPHMMIDHICCNKGCVNPDHLEQVTRAVNKVRWHISGTQALG